MALQKQPVNINFAKGLDTKTDPWQVSLDRFLNLTNAVFNKVGMLQKRNGFKQLSTLPDTTSTYATTFNGGLTAIGQNLNAYSTGTASWVNKGKLQPLDLSVRSAVRTANGQVSCDMAVNGSLTCVVYYDTANNPYYQIFDNEGSTAYAPVLVPGLTTPLFGSPPPMLKVAALGNYFVVVFIATTQKNYQYIAIPISNLSSPTAATNIFSAQTNYIQSFDIVSANGYLYIVAQGGGASATLLARYLDTQLNLGTSVSIVTAGGGYTGLSIVADNLAVPNLWITYKAASSATVDLTVYSQKLAAQVLAPTPVATISAGLSTLTTVYNNGLLEVYTETAATYSYNSAIYGSNTRTDILQYLTADITGTASAVTTLVRGVSLLSKAFLIGTKSYVAIGFSSPYQATYFLTNSSGNILSKLAYSNGVYPSGLANLPSISLSGSTAQFPYLFTDFVQAANKAQGSSLPPVYVQTGINIATYNFDPVIQSAEIGNNLHVSGGQLTMFDGLKPVEHGFYLYPDYIEAIAHTSGSGVVSNQQYYYQITYEWTDGQGNIHRSSPSLPIGVNKSSGDSIQLKINTLRLTAKTNVRIVIYRWSAAQQNYYQVTSITSPLLNDTTTDSVTYVDNKSDAQILGNALIYTTGGVVENIAAPAMSIMTLFKSRLVGVNAEDPNVLWYSKQVIETTPVEMSDLFTIYIPPTTGIESNSGKATALYAMDDKLIVFKANGINYLTGNGPDNTGANNDFSDPIYISSSVGCINRNSLVTIPAGVMFQSNKGIWLLGRDLSTQYIGAPVEAYNSANVLSATLIPGTNQVRFSLDNGIVLMYDYFYNEWSTFNNIGNLSSTLYQGLHTYIDQYARIFQENPGSYLDGALPVLMSFTTSWIKLAGLQGFQRAYFLTLLGQYYSPHKLVIDVGYDYQISLGQRSIITPSNYAGTYGSDSVYGGGSVYGGSSPIEQWQVFFQQQKCEAIQITLSELYDPTYSAPAGAGLTLSGLNIVIGVKKGYRPINRSNQVG